MKKSEIFKRQLDLVKPEELEFPILIIGAGGIGSWTALTLAKMGCSNITVVDHDTVETHNIPSQFYKTDQIGWYKVNALKDNIKEFTDIEINPIFGKYDEVKLETKPRVIICAVDSLKTRKEIWDSLQTEDHWDCFIDARMGGETLRLFVINPLHEPSVTKYEKSLTSKAKAHEEQCTAKAIVYNTQMAGGLVANLVKKFAKQEQTKMSFIVDMIQQEIV